MTDLQSKPWPPLFRVVRQSPGSKDCTACVAAMALGLTLEEAKRQMQGWQLPDGSVYYRNTELIKILGAYGVVMGFYFRPGDVEKGERVTKDVRLTLDIPLKGMVGILAVKSNTQSLADHCVFFDGENVLDPQHDEPQSVTDYRILDIYPLLYYIDKPWDKDEKPAAPPEGDLKAMAQCLVDNPSWDNLLCGRYGRALARHFLSRPTPIYDKLIKDFKDAGITFDRGSVRIDAPAQSPPWTVEQVRDHFWREHPQFDRNLKLQDYGYPTFPTDVRNAWVDYIYRMAEENRITQETSDHITLDDQQPQHSNEIESILHRVQYTFDIPPEIVLDDILREDLDEMAHESIKDQILNGFRAGKLTHYEGDKTIEGEWKIIGE